MSKEIQSKALVKWRKEAHVSSLFSKLLEMYSGSWLLANVDFLFLKLKWLSEYVTVFKISADLIY